MRRGRRAAAAAPMKYDGGQPTNPPNKAGKEITVVDVPKLIGIGYFNATSKGIQDAAKELGNVKAKTDGPTEAKIDEQIKFIDNYITSGVDGILFAANDPGRHRAGAEEGAVEGHPRRRLRRQLDARRARMVRQPGAVQRHRQGDDGLDGQGERRGRQLRHRHLDLHHAEPGALDRRDAGLRGQVPSEAEVARDGRGAGGQQPLLQPGDDADQQVRRQAQGPVRHDVGRDAGFRRSGHARPGCAARSRSSGSPRRTR